MPARYWIAAAVVAAIVILIFVGLGRADEDRGAWFRRGSILCFVPPNMGF